MMGKRGRLSSILGLLCFVICAWGFHPWAFRGSVFAQRDEPDADEALTLDTFQEPMEVIGAPEPA